MTDDVRTRNGELTVNGLSVRQLLFCAYYVEGGEAKAAAERAGYQVSSGNVVNNLLKNELVQNEIRRLVGKAGMQTEEILIRLTEQARNEGARYITEDGELDMVKMIRDGKQHLIKKIKKRTTISVKGAETEYNEIEFYDAQKALELLGKHLRMWVNVREDKHTFEMLVSEKVQNTLDRIYDGEDVIDVDAVEIEAIDTRPVPPARLVAIANIEEDTNA